MKNLVCSAKNKVQGIKTAVMKKDKGGKKGWKTGWKKRQGWGGKLVVCIISQSAWCNG